MAWVAYGASGVAPHSWATSTCRPHHRRLRYIPDSAPVVGSQVAHVLGHQVSPKVRHNSRTVLGKDIRRTLTKPYSSTTVRGEKVKDSHTGKPLEDSVFTAFNTGFYEVLGLQEPCERAPGPAVRELASVDWELAHEGPVWLPERQKIVFNTNRLGDTGSPAQHIQTWTLSLGRQESLRLEKLSIDPPVAMANGGTNWAENEVLFTAQGHKEEGGALVAVDVDSGRAETLLDNWQGLRFNSPNDLTVGQDRSVWFTDPQAGYLQNFRGKPQLGNHVWRFDYKTGSLNLAAIGFEMPNGIVLSPDGKTLYVTDTGAMRPDTPDGGKASTAEGARTIYAFDVVQKPGGPVLVNRRAFAIADTGAPDGIKVDIKGNVYAGMGDGVAVWNEGGVMLGKINVGQVGQLVFAGDLLVMLQETRILAVKLGISGPALPGMLPE